MLACSKKNLPSELIELLTGDFYFSPMLSIVHWVKNIVIFMENVIDRDFH